MCFTCY